jgi:hypothetical protein
LELFGYVRFVPDSGGGEPSELIAQLDFTSETAALNPGWKLDLCEEEIGVWRGARGALATMTLVWGHPLLSGGAVATAELGGLTVDQCELMSERFTLIAPDSYGGDLLEIKLFDARGRELARESLYEPDEADGEAETEDGGAAQAQAP